MSDRVDNTRMEKTTETTRNTMERRSHPQPGSCVAKTTQGSVSVEAVRARETLVGNDIPVVER